MSEPRVRRVLFVCLGNICRSPLAEGLARLRAAELGLALEFDSAGTADYHVGHPPDPRARALARQHGYPIDALRGRQAQAADFLAFDLILAADASNLAALQRLRPPGAHAALARLLDYAGADTADVPDPYYGDAADFERVHALLDAAMPALLRRAARA